MVPQTHPLGPGFGNAPCPECCQMQTHSQNELQLRRLEPQSGEVRISGPAKKGCRIPHRFARAIRPPLRGAVNPQNRRAAPSHGGISRRGERRRIPHRFARAIRLPLRGAVNPQNRRAAPSWFSISDRFRASSTQSETKNHQTVSGGSADCGDSRIRTGDPMLAKHVLYQLSYTPEERVQR